MADLFELLAALLELLVVVFEGFFRVLPLVVEVTAAIILGLFALGRRLWLRFKGKNSASHPVS